MYDTKCRQLAEEFLEDEPPERRTEQNAHDLAQVIQDAIEGYLTVLREVNRPRADER